MSRNFYDDPRFFEGYRRMRDGPVTINDRVEQPALRACLPPLAGLDVLELGCGMGQLSLHLARGGGRVLAVDVSEKMLAVARRKRAHEQIDYSLRAIEEVDAPSAFFDLVVSSFAVHYVEDYRALVRRVEGWLKPGGHFVYSIEHPMATAPRDPERSWVTDAEGDKIFWPLSGYGEEGPREQTWYVEGIIKHHRKVSTLINVLIEEGLTIERIEEPEEVPSQGQARPAFPENGQRPSVLVVRSAKDTR